MGWCHEFGLHITPRCDHPMVAGRSACSCDICGTECPGKFDKACEDVWDRSLRRVAPPSPSPIDTLRRSMDLEWTPSGPAEDAPSATVLQMRPAEDAPTLPGIELVAEVPGPEAPVPVEEARRAEPAPPPGVSPLFPVEPLVRSERHPAASSAAGDDQLLTEVRALAAAVAGLVSTTEGLVATTDGLVATTGGLAGTTEGLAAAAEAQRAAVDELRHEVEAVRDRQPPPPQALDADELVETLKAAVGATVTENRRIAQQIDLAQRRVAELAETLPDRTAEATAQLVTNLAQRVEAAAGGVEAVGRIRHVLSELSARMGQLQGEVTRLAMAQEAIAARIDSADRRR